MLTCSYRAKQMGSGKILSIENLTEIEAKSSHVILQWKLVKKVMFISQIPGEELNSKERSINQRCHCYNEDRNKGKRAQQWLLTYTKHCNIHNCLPMHFLFLNIMQKLKQCFYTDITVQKFGVGKIFLCFWKYFMLAMAAFIQLWIRSEILWNVIQFKITFFILTF